MITGIDTQTPTWRRLKDHARDRIAELQVKLETPADAESTAFLRGQIAELRKLLSDAERPPVAPDVTRVSGPTPSYG